MRGRLKVKNKESQMVLASNAKLANGFWDRLIGLMFKKEMKNMDGLILAPCNSIHTCFMRYPIDVVFLSKDLEVVAVERCMRPWRFTRMYFKSAKVLELVGGSLDPSITIGSKLEIEDV